MTNEEIQQALVNDGFDLGKSGKNKNGVDGDFGPKSKAALAAFRSKYNLDLDLASQTTQQLLVLLSNVPVDVKPASGVPAGATRLLEFIAKHEAGGNYDAYYAHGKNHDPKLSALTLAEVAAFQKDMLAKGAKSTAVGAYQFIQKTLQVVKNSIGLSGTDLFSPENQHRMAFELLRGRGWDRYVRGDINAITFGNEVAKEWASMPVLSGPKKGKSYYAGDGLNSALTSVSDFQAAIENALA